MATLATNAPRADHEHGGSWQSAQVEFNLYVELDRTETPSPDQFRTLAKLTRDYRADWSISPASWLAVRYTTQAEVLRQAVDAAFVLVPDWAHRAGLGWHTPVAIEAMSAVEVDQRRGELVGGELIGVREVAAIIGKSEPRVKQIAEEYGGRRIGRDWVFIRSAVKRVDRLKREVSDNSSTEEE